jgi:hypothetical protein
MYIKNIKKAKISGAYWIMSKVLVHMIKIFSSVVSAVIDVADHKY